MCLELKYIGCLGICSRLPAILDLCKLTIYPIKLLSIIEASVCPKPHFGISITQICNIRAKRDYFVDVLGLRSSISGPQNH